MTLYSKKQKPSGIYCSLEKELENWNKPNENSEVSQNSKINSNSYLIGRYFSSMFPS